MYSYVLGDLKETDKAKSVKKNENEMKKEIQR